MGTPPAGVTPAESLAAQILATLTAAQHAALDVQAHAVADAGRIESHN